MAIDLSTAPYYDDFDKEGNFYRILFKPGKAVQARELTQLQTALQNQIEQFGRNIFKDGTLVLGGRASAYGGVFLKIDTSDVTVDNFVDETIVGSTSGARAVVKLSANSRLIDGTSYPATLYVLLQSGSFLAGESFVIEGSATGGTLDSGSTYTGPTTFFSIDKSVFFTKGHFVFCPAQTIYLSDVNVTQPSARVGLEITEGVRTSDDDVSLLDPAVGSSNYFAPGADRYFIDLTLTSIQYDPTVEDSDEITVDEFIEIANIRNGTIISQLRNTEYAILEDTLARRTFDESGDYTVKPFIVNVRDHVYGNVDKLSVEISPGKAYVKGYEFETIAPTYITMDRARDTVFVDDFPGAADYGRYTAITNVNGIFNTHNSQIVYLHNKDTANVLYSSNVDFFSSVIGTARTRYFEQESGNVYNLYLFDIKLNSGQNFSNTKAFVETSTTNVVSTSNITAQANVSGTATITYATDDSLVFQLPQEKIKTFSNATFTSQVIFPNTSFSTDGTNCTATITLTGNDSFIGSGLLSDDAINARFFAAVTSTTNTTTFPVRTVLNFVGANGEVNITSTQTATLKVLGAHSFSANIVALTQTSGVAASKTKTLANSTLVVTTTGNLYNISLNVPDVVGVTSIYDATGNSYLGSYILDTGQRDDFYDHGSVVLKPGISPPALDANTNPNVTIQFQYFTHSGSGYFDVDSYASAGIDYREIPKFKTSNGDVISLSDVIDFRPVRTAGGNAIVSTKLIQPGSTITADYEYYIPRIDKLVLTKERRFVVVKGVSSTAPVVPNDLPDGMTLYSFSLPAYTTTASEVKSTYYDHRRFTMRDIGKIEKRVDRLEYYSALSLLEKIAADERIPSDVPGIDRFKNGILVDSFAGHSVGDVNNGDYKCSIDPTNRTLRPLCVAESVDYFLDTGSSSNYAKNGDLVTLTYSVSPYISQLKATRDVNLTPFEVFDWTGRMTLNPATDVWGDTINAPTVTINLNGENDAFTQFTVDQRGLSPWSTMWNSWQTVFTGVTDVGVSSSAITSVDNEVSVDDAGNITVTPTSRTSTTTSTTVTSETAQARTGLQFLSASKAISTNLGTKIIDSSLIPFIRSRSVKFYAQGLKANTRLYATFDNVDVSQYCSPAVEIKFTTNTVPTTNLTAATFGSWTGEIVGRRNDRIYVIPDSRYRLPESGNVVAFANTVVTATVSSVKLSNVLATNEFGDAAGVFNIPNNSELRFSMGERAFRLADNLNKTFITTSAETKYLAYGLSQTTQGTILSTRMNLVSVNPLLDITRTSAGSRTTTVADNGVETIGTSNTEALPPTQQITNVTNNITNNIDITNQITNIDNSVNVTNNITNVQQNITNNNNTNIVQNAIQTLFCSQEINTTGRTGIHTFRINLGTGTGSGNIVCSSAAIPDRFTLDYNGKVTTTGFMSSSSSVATYNERLKFLGYPEVTRTNTSTFRLPFEKLSEGVEFALVTVDAPLAGTGWSFTTECPSGVTADPGTGVAVINNADKLPFSFLQNFDRYWSSRLRTTAELTGAAAITITNTATNPRWTINGNDKSITITGISFEYIETEPSPTGFRQVGKALPSGVTVTALTTGSSRRVISGVYEFITGGGTYGNSTTNPTQNYDLGALPITLQPGTSRIFGVSIAKSAAASLRGVIRVNITAVGPNNQPVAINSVDLNVSTQVLSNTWVEDPIAQTFFVLEGENPNGVFVPSIDVFFREKDNTVPVVCELRPVVNGFPSSGEIVPFAVATVNAEDVVVSATPTSTSYTRFTFPSPVYLAPGQYCFVLRASSNNYKAYTAVLGEYSLANTDERITKQPYIGSLFKSQNASVWTPEQNEDIMFRINKCNFSTSSTASVTLNVNAPSNNVEYDVFYTSADILDFAVGTTGFAYSSTPESTGIVNSTFNNYTLGYNIPMDERMLVKSNDGTSLKFRIQTTTRDSSVSPVIDLNRLQSVLARNIINNDATGEDSYSGGNALAKYITRRVVLNPGFEASDLKVTFNAYCPGNSSVKVYYKVNAPGTTEFDTQNKYVEMTSSTVVGNQRSGFAEFSYETNGALPDSALFNTFVIKVVMLSDSTIKVPIIRDFRVIALDE